MTGHRIDFIPVIVTARPTDLAPADFDPADARLCRAADVTAGDLVLGWVMETPGGRQVVDYHTDAYEAAPVPHDPACGCPSHDALSEDDAAGPLTVLTDGFPWDACDVMPSGALILIVPAEKPALRPQQAATAKQEPEMTDTLPDLRPLGRGCTFNHNGKTVYVFPTPKNPGMWSARPEGLKTIVSHRRNRDEAVRAAVRYLDGDHSRRTGFDMLAELLSL